jgi:hypothetical protein
MNNPHHNSESLETIFWVKILNSLMRIWDGRNSDPGWKKFGSGINTPRPETLLPYPTIPE